MFKKRKYPVNGVVPELCQQIADQAKQLQRRYERETRALGEKPLKMEPIKFYAVSSRICRAYYPGTCPGAGRVITISTWDINKGKQDPTALEWVVAHELAHQYNQMEARMKGKHQDGHGPNFMRWLRWLCPRESIHHELGYKPRNARASGIRPKNVEKLEEAA